MKRLIKSLFLLLLLSVGPGVQAMENDLNFDLKGDSQIMREVVQEALREAASEGCLKIVELILGHKYLQDNKLITIEGVGKAFVAASCEGHLKIVKILKNFKNKMGWE